MLKSALLAAAIGLLVVGTAQSATVTYAVDDVRSADGVVRGRLCADAARFPGGDCPYAAESPAQAGSVRLVFKDVAPGRYAFSVFHDANANGRLDMPTEGFAFGNDAGFPPRFEAAVIAVLGDTDAKVHLNYLTRRAEAVQAPATGETGAAAPPGVVKIDLRADGLYGALYAPAGAGDHRPGRLGRRPGRDQQSDGRIYAARLCGAGSGLLARAGSAADA